VLLQITPAVPTAAAIATIHLLAVALANQGVAESGLGEPRAASVSYGHALRLYGRLVEDEGRAEYVGDLANVIMLCGDNLLDLGPLDQALELLEQTVEYAKRRRAPGVALTRSGASRWPRSTAGCC
jgi:hypothetical protein